MAQKWKNPKSENSGPKPATDGSAMLTLIVTLIVMLDQGMVIGSMRHEAGCRCQSFSGVPATEKRTHKGRNPGSRQKVPT